MADEIAALLSKTFISRRDAKAQQARSGAYMPVVDDDGNRLGFTMGDLRAHVEGTATYGHYLLDTDDKVKCFAFDIDLVSGWPIPGDRENLEPIPYEAGMTIDPVEVWRTTPEDDGRHLWLTVQLRSLAEGLASRVKTKLGIPVAIAYSGNKGLHVYGLTGYTEAAKARRAAHLILTTFGGVFENWKGEHFYRYVRDPEQPTAGYPALSIEVFPKQDSLGGKDLGNLLRLPLGINQKSGKPGFFLDLKADWDVLRPADPERALTTGDPWA
jgi:hypothetical protein